MPITPSFLKTLKKIKPPVDFFNGTPPFSFTLPRNILLFHRKKVHCYTSYNDYHHRFVLVVNLQTNGSVVLDGLTHKLSPGQALLIFPFQYHHISDIALPKTSWLFITFEADRPEYLLHLRNCPVNLSQDFLLHLEQLVNVYLQKPCIESDRYNKIIICTTSLLADLACLKSSRTNRIIRLTPKLRFTYLLIQKTHNFIIDNLDKKFKVYDLAGNVDVSESHLCAVYRKSMGISLGKYILQMRIAKARELLENSDHNVSEIARACGYESLFSFSRAFKGFTGFSPLGSRKQRTSELV